MARISLSELVARAALLGDATVKDILGPARHNHLVYLRRAIVLAARAQEQRLSYPEIGRRMNRDHSTIIHAKDMGLIALKRDPYFARLVMALCEGSITGMPLTEKEIEAVDLISDRVGKVEAEEIERVVLEFSPPEPITAKEPIREESLDDMDLLSLRVAAHYGRDPELQRHA